MEKNDNKKGNMFLDMLYGNTLYALSILIISVSATTIFNFVGIEFEYYGVYLFFFIGLAILSQVLPKNKNSLIKASNKS